MSVQFHSASLLGLRVAPQRHSATASFSALQGINPARGPKAVAFLFSTTFNPLRHGSRTT
ncbi:MAG: hypothetical protein JSU02_05025 [Bacteroidetes bacterium]|nr:hypothetical protein [Bacteroidota bacterium]